MKLTKIEEHWLIAIQHLEIQKQQQKAWHERNIKNNNFSVGDITLLYNTQEKGKPKKMHIECMGPYIIEEINANGSVQLRRSQGTVFQKLVNGARLKRYEN